MGAAGFFFLNAEDAKVTQRRREEIGLNAKVANGSKG